MKAEQSNIKYQYLVTIRNAGEEYQRIVSLTQSEEEQVVAALDALDESSRISSYDMGSVPPTEESLTHLLNWANDCADEPEPEDEAA